MYCGMPKGTSQAETTPNSEKKIKSVALAIVHLHWSEGISLSVSQLVNQSVENSVKSINFKIL